METYDLKGQQRMDWIDVAKGIAAILVVVVHVCTVNVEETSDFLVNMLGSLHNPIFYLCSGILFSLKKPMNNSIKILFDKVLDLLVTFVVWCIVYTVYAKVIIDVTQSDYVFSQWENMNKLWFLPVLFLAFCTTIFGEKLRLKAMHMEGILLVGMVAGAFISSMLAKIACYTFIFYIGTGFKTIGKKEKIIGIFCIVVWGGIVAACYMTGLITMQDNFKEGVKLLVMLVNCIAGAVGFTYVIYSFTDNLSRYIKRVFQYVGQNSFYIYILHNLIIYLLQIMNLNYAIYRFAWGGVALIFPLISAKIIRGSIVDKVLFRPSKIIKR